ncbi:MAG: prephenate dehydrogenase [Roseburia sp.]|nr:prephenate dehydrogenase [Roseburia sp.]MCM1278732.1 prephenate dehydrogenase [Robinsoniella sp.]
MDITTCAFMGLGLIGGSIAKAIKKAKPHIQIKAFDINQQTLLLAQQEGTIDKAYPSLKPDFFQCDIFFLCAPVSKNDENLRNIKEYLPKNCILTDVGSVKSGIHQVILKEGLTSCFIGGHPMAGSEKAGYANSNPLLLENAYYVLTPTESVPEEFLDSYKELVASFGAIPLILDYKEHDYITAAISHLPHIIASSLVNLVKDSDTKEGLMKLIAAGGFKDITRIASSSPIMWQQICMANRENIRLLLDDYIASLSHIRDMLDTLPAPESMDSIYSLFDTAKSYRDSFPNASSGPIKKIYDIYLEVPDEAGSIARTSVILAENHISIKNIGIMHNREFEEGALRIEFYEEAAKHAAIQLLREKNYKIYTAD